MAYAHGDSEQFQPTGGRLPEGPGPNCSVVLQDIIDYIIPDLTNIPDWLRSILDWLLIGTTVPTITDALLHPSVNQLVTSLMGLKDGTVDYRSDVGVSLRTTFSKCQRVGDDFTADVQVHFAERPVFTGNMRARGAFGRGKVYFAHLTGGTIELLYLHLLELAVRNEQRVLIRLGVLEIDGVASNLSTVRDTLVRDISSTLQSRKRRYSRTPLLDSLTPFGAFPAAGYAYFHGFYGRLVEKGAETANSNP